MQLNAIGSRINKCVYLDRRDGRDAAGGNGCCVVRGHSVAVYLTRVDADVCLRLAMNICI